MITIDYIENVALVHVDSEFASSESESHVLKVKSHEVKSHEVKGRV